MNGGLAVLLRSSLSLPAVLGAMFTKLAAPSTSLRSEAMLQELADVAEKQEAPSPIREERACHHRDQGGGGPRGNGTGWGRGGAAPVPEW